MHIEDTGRPVRSVKASRPSSPASSSASSAPRVSCQAIEAVAGLPSGPSRTTVSAMLVTPTPTTRPSGAASSAATTARMAASKRSLGSASAPVGTGRQGVGALPQEISLPSGPTTAALVMVVPTSIPTSNSGGTLDIVGETCKVAKGLRTGEECMSFTADGEVPESAAEARDRRSSR